jgi:hypothetical protein
MTTISRRGFVGGAFALGACGACGIARAADGAAPRLRFGVMSDVHIGGKSDAVETLEKTLRWFAAENVDAVLCAGDVAHSGLIGELEKFAAAWYRVFPEGRAADGHKVELMISTGNHDVDAWGGRWSKFTEEEMLAMRFNYKDNAEKTWRCLFNQPWEVVWRREVKGYTFIGSQWSSLNPQVEAFMNDNAATLDPAKPFFYCQHEHPNGTCHKYLAKGANSEEVVRALSKFPNAVAFSGHSHLAISDERAVWQGAFTSIGAGCIHEGSAGFKYDNISAFWHPSGRKNLMASMADPKTWGGDAKGGACELVEVFDDRLVVHRQSVVFGRPIAPSWIVPIPARKGGPMDFGRRVAQRKASGAIPQFADDAAISAKFCPNGHELESAAHRGEACTYVTFPRAKTTGGSRVFDYVVEASVDGAKPVVRKLVAAGFAYPETDADIPGECLFSAAEVPADKPVRFTVTPRDCFGLSGKPLVCDVQR